MDKWKVGYRYGVLVIQNELPEKSLPEELCFKLWLRLYEIYSRIYQFIDYRGYWNKMEGWE